MKKSLILTFGCLLSASAMFAQNGTVHGVVTDSQGEPVIGATIKVVGTKRATVTDMNGEFAIQASGKEKLNISYVGTKSEVVTAKNNLKIVLQDDDNTLSDVVVVGYGTQKKATLTGAVSAITNKEMVVTKNENVVNMLSGKVSGVRITQNSSQPGEYDNNIDIRGMGAPLIVVDGIPRDQAYFSRMDASEIDNVSVLKDASAAIYGVRAANGVILVTTKHGTSSKEGSFELTFSANYGIQSFLYLPKTASAVDHMLLYNEKVHNAFGQNYPYRYKPGTYSYDQMFEYSTGKKQGTNWTDELFDKTSPQQQYNVTMNGSSKKIDYFFNLGYLDQMGSYSSHSLNYKRWNFRSNVDARITDRLKATAMLSGYMDEKNQPYTDIWAVYKKAWTYKPTSEAYIDGDHSFPAYDDQMIESENPVAAINSDLTGFRQQKRYNFNGSLTLEYKIPYVDGLSAKAFYSYDYYTTNNTEFQRTYNLYRKNADGSMTTYVRNDPGKVNRSTDPNWGTVMQLSLNYDHKFGAHHVQGLFLFEETYNTWDNFYAQRETYLDNMYLFAGEEKNQLGSMYGIGDKTRRAWIGRVNYDYLGRYMAEFAFREDGSSSFAKNGRWGFFPSASIGWRASEEPWLKELVPFMNNLKLRLSYGKMGDDSSAGTYPPNVIGYSINKNYGWFYDSSLIAGVSSTGIPNPNLTWYTAKTFNFGVDFDLWNGMLGGTMEFFKRKRDGLLTTSSVVLPSEIGANMPQENLESDETFGWEFTLTHRNHIRDFHYNVSAQISATKNRWDHKLDSRAGNSMENWYRGDVSGRNKDIWFNIEEGGRYKNYEDIWYHGTTGDVDSGTLPGDYWYKDWNGDGIIDGADSHPMATRSMPVFNYGISLSADWKGIDLSMNWQGAAGIYNSYDEVFTEVCPFNGGAALDIYKDRWYTVDPEADPWNPHTEWKSGYYPATGHSFNRWGSAIHNTSYIRLKTLEIGYTLPKKWLMVTGIKSLRIYANAYNLLTISGLKNMDPERPGHTGGINGGGEGILFYNYPVNRTFNFGASIKF